MPIRDLNRALDWNLPDDEAVTIAGLVIHETQTIPEERQAFTFFHKRFTVLKREKNRIAKLSIRPATVLVPPKKLGSAPAAVEAPPSLDDDEYAYETESEFPREASEDPGNAALLGEMAPEDIGPPREAQAQAQALAAAARDDEELEGDLDSDREHEAASESGQGRRRERTEGHRRTLSERLARGDRLSARRRRAMPADGRRGPAPAAAPGSRAARNSPSDGCSN